MLRYEKTIVQRKPELLNKKLLLIKASREGLFTTKSGSYVQIEIDKKGEIAVNAISTQMKYQLLNMSLRKIGETYLNIKDPSVTQMLKYFVLPEMEVERIFNSLRYKYLQAIDLSKFKNPAHYINSKYNKAFQALAGVNIYQGPTKNRKDNDDFWKKEGFSSFVKKNLNWEQDKEELGHIIRLIKKIYANTIPAIYAELIAIKPGFHEIWLHSEYFKKPVKGSMPRDSVFRMLRRKERVTENYIDKMPSEINRKSYFSYAPCNVTEGPFVFRKDISISYFKEIRDIRSKDEINQLEKYFHILDYCKDKIESRKKMKEILNKGKKFTKFS